MPTDVSAHPTLISREQKKVTQDTTLEKNVSYSFVENTFFPIKRDTWLSSGNTNRYRIIICKITENNWQNVPAVLSIHTSSHFNYISVLSFRLLWLSLYGPRSKWGAAGVSFAVDSGPNSIDGSGCYSCIAHVRGQRRHKKISYYLKKMRNTIAYPTQQSSSSSRGIPCSRKRGNDDRGTVV